MTDGEILFPPAVLRVIFSFPSEYNSLKTSGNNR